MLYYERRDDEIALRMASYVSALLPRPELEAIIQRGRKSDVHTAATLAEILDAELATRKA